MRKLILILWLPHLLYSQNLITNPSFEKKNQFRYTYADAHRTIEGWGNIRAERVMLSFALEGCFVDTTFYYIKNDSELYFRNNICNIDTICYKNYSKVGLFIDSCMSEHIINPANGNCYIRNNKFKRQLFYQSLKTKTMQGEYYVVSFAFQAKSCTNELQNIHTAHIGVSLTKDLIDPYYFIKPTFSTSISPKFRELHFINSASNLDTFFWNYASFTFKSTVAFSHLYLGAHTDFIGEGINNFNEDGDKKFVYKTPITWYFDDLKLMKLSDFLNQDIRLIKGHTFELPIDDFENLDNNLYLKQFILMMLKFNNSNATIKFYYKSNSANDHDEFRKYLVTKGIRQKVEFDETLENKKLSEANTLEFNKITILVL